MKWLAESFVLMRGWTIDGTKPDEPKFVLIGVPHTSNWDFIAFLALVHHFDLRVKFLIKDGLMVWPLSWFMTRWGAIPVDRTSHNHLIDEAVRSFNEHDEMLLAIAPEGTRARADRWRSGFWRIADAADVPVVMGFIDGHTKRMGLGPARRVNGDPDAWMAEAAVFYADKHGVEPRNAGPVQL
jgi:1-acyl-sn-glycerol-3-phosphate acyltransferase